MSPSHQSRPACAGFTLIELMIAVAIMVILAALAWPALTEAVQKSRRADGMSALARIMQAQERLRASQPAYAATLAALPGATEEVSADQHYALSLGDNTARPGSLYIARATVRSSSPQAGDTRCQVLEVEVDGGRITYRSRNSSGLNGTPDPCWAR